MHIIIDIIIAASAFLAAAYCLLLSRRLRAFTRLDGDVGKAIAILSQQVDALTRALQAAEQSSQRSNATLEQQITRADAAARQLELLMAAQQKTPAANHADDRTWEPAQAGTAAGTENCDFAPFGRSTIRPADARQRVIRRREPAGYPR